MHIHQISKWNLLLYPFGTRSTRHINGKLEMAISECLQIEIHWNEHENENDDDDVIGKCLNELYANTDTKQPLYKSCSKTSIARYSL